MSSRMIRIRISMLSAFIIAVTWLPAVADVLDKVAGDFKPLSGYVVMVKDSEYIIDLDAKKGIFTGDLFSVLQPGEKIVHPVSGEILGTLEELKGILKVTRLQEGYSYARPFGKIEGIKQGDPIRRYENIPALFWDYSGSGEPFFLQLRNTLPHLKWQDYAAAQAAKPNIPAASKIDSPTLIFILKKEGLEVRDSEFQIIHTYGSLGLLPVAVEPTPKAATSIEEGVGYQATYPGLSGCSRPCRSNSYGRFHTGWGPAPHGNDRWVSHSCLCCRQKRIPPNQKGSRRGTDRFFRCSGGNPPTRFPCTLR